MSNPKEQRLGVLFDITLEGLIKKIESGEATAADLNVARQMLKDNGIDAAPGTAPGLTNLAKVLPEGAFGGPEDIGTLQ